MVASSPASAVDICQIANSDGITKVNICTSSASSDQPPKQAIMVRRSRVVRSRIQASIVVSPGASERRCRD